VREGPLQDAARGALGPLIVPILAVALGPGCGSNGATSDASFDRIAIMSNGGAGGHADASLGDGPAGLGGAGDASSGVPQTLPDASAPFAGTALDTFDTEVDFGFEPYHDTTATNLADPAVIDAGTAPSLAFDGAEGSPSPGSMKVTVPFSGANQYVQIQSYVFVVPQDWSGHSLHVRLKVDEGSVFHGVASLYVNTGVSYIAASTAVPIASGSDWQEIAMDVDHPMTVSIPDRYSAKQVVLYGLELDSGSAGTGATPATFHVDSFTLD
jgi:hypothetical protein